GGIAPEKQNAAKVLFAAGQEQKLEANTPVFTLQANSYAEKIDKVRSQLAVQAIADYTKIAAAVKDFSTKGQGDLKALGGVHYLVKRNHLPESVLKDEWNSAYEFQASPWGGYLNGLVVWSYGPDRRKATVDDIVVRGYPQSAQQPQVVPLDANMFDEMRVQDDKGDQMWFAGDAGGFGGVRRGAGADMFFDRAASNELKLNFGAAGPMVVDAVNGDMDGDGKNVFAFATAGKLEEASPARPEVRIRSYFPETLYFNPAVITGDDGKAAINVDMADSITTWRLTAMGSSLNGLLGSTTSGIKVFQDFFIDIDLPIALTQNDEASIPIAVYNYLPVAQKIELVLTKEAWFDLDGVDKQTLSIPANSVKGIHYRIKVKEIGWHKLTVHAYGSKMNDAIRREIEVMPDGERQEASINDRLEKDVTKTVTIPAKAIDGASNVLVKIYPGIFSQVVEGMDSLLRMPNGCFEQTSSVTYPNILVLDYMRRTKLSTPEIQMKAEQYINLGYQRLLSYECKMGGFEWFGNDPANQVLTAYGLLEFSDMRSVYEVDENVIRRTQSFLIGKQSADGTWTPDKGGIAEGAINRQTDEFRTTAYVLWALASSGADSAAVNKGLNYLTNNWAKVNDAYALAVAMNAFLATPDGKSKCIDPCQKLADMHKKDDKGIYWTTDGNTAVSSTGASADVETTALAALALMKTGRYNDLVTGALTYLIKSKDPQGTWGSTQVTIFALKALISSMENRTSEVNAKVSVLVNGKEAGSFQLTPENSDVLRQVDCKNLIREGDNTIEIKFSGKGSSLYQISSYCYLPWENRPVDTAKQMDIKVAFDRTTLDTNDIVTSTVTAAYNGNGTANMVIVDLGTPPGFDVLAEDLEALVADKTFQKYSLTGRQTIIYIEKIEKGKPLSFKYRMKAKFPIKAKTPKSVVYQYYNPDVRDTAAPVDIVVRQ
ncbi:MAG: alpha-2-macroglobulin family protein, partial [Armatimonadota bacterium]